MRISEDGPCADAWRLQCSMASQCFWPVYAPRDSFFDMAGMFQGEAPKSLPKGSFSSSDREHYCRGSGVVDNKKFDIIFLE